MSAGKPLHTDTKGIDRGGRYQLGGQQSEPQSTKQLTLKIANDKGSKFKHDRNLTAGLN